MYVSCLVLSNSLWPHGLQSTKFLCPCNSPGKNIAVNCHFLLQGIFHAQGLNLDLLHCKQILYQLSHQNIYTYIYVKLNRSRYRCIPESLCYAPETYIIMYIKYTSIKILQLKKKSLEEVHWRHKVEKVQRNWKGKITKEKLWVVPSS